MSCIQEHFWKYQWVSKFFIFKNGEREWRRTKVDLFNPKESKERMKEWKKKNKSTDDPKNGKISKWPVLNGLGLWPAIIEWTISETIWKINLTTEVGNITREI